ncbi:hypothetical protein ACQKEX_14560 [Bacillus pumilus]|uniref:hypothetical protein n=1 Tax=Bacillus TaxID=1386 RepID=UPI00095A0044|nr:hypothetical protein [Bacillus pumilus]MBU8576448.1 hypothetical protein [Bacillus pumilus]OLP64352.1 hypothetical protein BACPU_25770 [Bacillus pumilus]
MEFMIGTFKFNSETEADALQIAKKKMFEKGWRNLRLMKNTADGWEVSKVIPSFEKGTSNSLPR